MLLGTLGASLLGNLLTRKDTIRAGEGTITAAQTTHPLTNFEIQKYYKMNLNWMVFIQEIIYLK